MSIALDGQLVENFAIDGQKVAGMAINGDRIYPHYEKEYIFDSYLNTNWNFPCYEVVVYESNNGVRGAYIETIPRGEGYTGSLKRIANYAPKVVKCFNQVLSKWYVSPEDSEIELNFAKLTDVGYNFMNDFYRYNGRVLFPKLQTAGSNFMYNASGHRQELEFPELRSLGDDAFFGRYSPFPKFSDKLQTMGSEFMRGATDLDGSTIISPDNATLAMTYFMKNFHNLDNTEIVFGYNVAPTFVQSTLGGISGWTNVLNVRFKAVQTITKLYSAFYGRDTNSTTHNYVNIILPVGSANVVAGSPGTWAGHTFKSVTLV